jgi:FHS family L-fucose permease-like MFS transporter
MTTFDNSKENNQTPALAVLSTLFFMWGLITVFSGILIEKEFINAFELTYGKAILITFIFFATYFIIAFPAGVLIDKIGFKNGIISGLLIAAIGCLMFYMAADKVSYPLTVTALFILASGITILQVCANPFVVMIGMRGRGASRLTLVGAFNSLGTLLASYFGVKLISSNSESLDPESIKAASADIVKGPYLLLAGILFLIAIFIAFSKLPKINTKSIEPLIKDTVPPRKNIFQFHHVVLGAIGIFAYVGAEVGIFRYLLTKSGTNEMVDTMIKVYWGGAMVGRFIGAAVLTKVSPRKMIAICSIAASLLVLGFIMMVPSSDGSSAEWNKALWMLVAVGAFNSVLFPCIFAMGIDGLGKFSEEGSSMLIMAIVGGSVIPFILLNLITADPASAKTAFILLIACYLFMLFYGLKGSRYQKRTNFY